MRQEHSSESTSTNTLSLDDDCFTNIEQVTRVTVKKALSAATDSGERHQLFRYYLCRAIATPASKKVDQNVRDYLLSLSEYFADVIAVLKGLLALQGADQVRAKIYIARILPYITFDLSDTDVNTLIETGAFSRLSLSQAVDFVSNLYKNRPWSLQNIQSLTKNLVLRLAFFVYKVKANPFGTRSLKDYETKQNDRDLLLALVESLWEDSHNEHTLPEILQHLSTNYDGTYRVMIPLDLPWKHSVKNEFTLSEIFYALVLILQTQIYPEIGQSNPNSLDVQDLTKTICDLYKQFNASHYHLKATEFPYSAPTLLRILPYAKSAHAYSEISIKPEVCLHALKELLSEPMTFIAMYKDIPPCWLRALRSFISNQVTDLHHLVTLYQAGLLTLSSNTPTPQLQAQPVAQTINEEAQTVLQALEVPEMINPAIPSAPQADEDSPSAPPYLIRFAEQMKYVPIEKLLEWSSESQTNTDLKTTLQTWAYDLLLSRIPHEFISFSGALTSLISGDIDNFCNRLQEDNTLRFFFKQHDTVNIDRFFSYCPCSPEQIESVLAKVLQTEIPTYVSRDSSWLKIFAYTLIYRVGSRVFDVLQTAYQAIERQQLLPFEKQLLIQFIKYTEDEDSEIFKDYRQVLLSSRACLDLKKRAKEHGLNWKSYPYGHPINKLEHSFLTLTKQSDGSEACPSEISPIPFRHLQWFLQYESFTMPQLAPYIISCLQGLLSERNANLSYTGCWPESSLIKLSQAQCASLCESNAEAMRTIILYQISCFPSGSDSNLTQTLQSLLEKLTDTCLHFLLGTNTRDKEAVFNWLIALLERNDLTHLASLRSQFVKHIPTEWDALVKEVCNSRSQEIRELISLSLRERTKRGQNNKIETLWHLFGEIGGYSIAIDMELSDTMFDSSSRYSNDTHLADYVRFFSPMALDNIVNDKFIIRFFSCFESQRTEQGKRLQIFTTLYENLSPVGRTKLKEFIGRHDPILANHIPLNDDGQSTVCAPISDTPFNPAGCSSTLFQQERQDIQPSAPPALDPIQEDEGSSSMGMGVEDESATQTVNALIENNQLDIISATEEQERLEQLLTEVARKRSRLEADRQRLLSLKETLQTSPLMRN